jgi:hypothetical protein
MQNASYTAAARFLLVTIVAVLTGCATTKAPAGWLPSAEEAQQRTLGGWIEVRGKIDALPSSSAGELIAISADSIYVLSADSLTVFALPDVYRARLFGYATNYPALGVWTAVGLLSTMSHGAALIFSAPMWLIGGTAATSAQSRKPLLEYPRHSWHRLRAFARFPQGLPPGTFPRVRRRR